MMARVAAEERSENMLAKREMSENQTWKFKIEN
jgi:hypothetical protein